MNQKSKLIWLIPLSLGILFDILFWKQIPGINFFIFVVFCLLGGFLVLQRLEVKPSIRSWFLVIPILFFAAVTFVHQEPMTVFLGGFFTLFLLAELTFTYKGGQWVSFGIFDHLTAFLGLGGGMLAKPFGLLSSRPSNNENINRSNKKGWAVFRGVLLAIPVLLIFTYLLSSADLVFAQKVESFTSFFRLEKLPEYIFRLAYILIGTYLFMGVFLHAAATKQNEYSQEERKPLLPAFVGFIETSIILSSVVILFTLFVIVQFKYFFGGAANIHLDGFTYAEYARKGFGELVAVAAISLILLMGLSGLSKKEKPVHEKVFSGLGIAIVLLVGVMLISAYQRLILYETAYGFSELRTYTHVFIIWLAVLLLAVMILELIRKERYFTLAAILAAIGFAATLPIMNVDGFIVKRNIERAKLGQELDVSYLASLGYDAVPGLADQFKDPNIPSELHEQVGAALVCMQDSFSSNDLLSWRSYHYSRSKAMQELRRLDSSLTKYTLEKETYNIMVTTPSGQKIDCMNSGGLD